MKINGKGKDYEEGKVIFCGVWVQVEVWKVFHFTDASSIILMPLSHRL